MTKECEGVRDPACVRRFLAKVAPPNVRGCRLWTGAAITDAAGFRHGTFRGGPKAASGRKVVYAHRFAWELANDRPIPEGLQVRHSCDDSMCCEPNDLGVGTGLENARDKLERFVAANGGEGHGMAKLTWAECREIYDLAWLSPMTNPQVAAAYGIARSYVCPASSSGSTGARALATTFPRKRNS